MSDKKKKGKGIRTARTWRQKFTVQDAAKLREDTGRNWRRHGIELVKSRAWVVTLETHANLPPFLFLAFSAVVS